MWQNGCVLPQEKCGIFLSFVLIHEGEMQTNYIIDEGEMQTDYVVDEGKVQTN